MMEPHPKDLDDAETRLARLGRAEPLEAACWKAPNDAMQEATACGGVGAAVRRRPLPALLSGGGGRAESGRRSPPNAEAHKGCNCQSYVVVLRESIQIHRIHKEIEEKCRIAKSKKTRLVEEPTRDDPVETVETARENPGIDSEGHKKAEQSRGTGDVSPRRYVEELRHENGKYRQRAARGRRLRPTAAHRTRPRHREAGRPDRSCRSTRTTSAAPGSPRQSMNCSPRKPHLAARRPSRRHRARRNHPVARLPSTSPLCYGRELNNPTATANLG